MDAHSAQALLDEFEKLSTRVARPQTFMEIAGYPHYENVCSNFLAFFFDPGNPHGLGSLFLDALANAVGVAGAKQGFGGISVKREVATEKGNRIDLLVTSESHAVLIENKIFANVTNPLKDYTGYLDDLKNDYGVAYEEDHKAKILLTLHPTSEGKEWGFKNLTHSGFASAVRSSLEHYVPDADNRYLTLMLDLLNTLEHLGEGTRMDNEFIELLGERRSEVEEFLVGLNEMR